MKDTEQKHTSEIAAQIRKVNAADYESRADESDEQAYARAMRDPEVRLALSHMRSLLRGQTNQAMGLMPRLERLDSSDNDRPSDARHTQTRTR